MSKKIFKGWVGRDTKVRDVLRWVKGDSHTYLLNGRKVMFKNKKSLSKISEPLKRVTITVEVKE